MVRRILLAAVIFFLGFSVHTAFASPDSVEVAVTARVELSPQHIFGIQKNSTLTTNFREDRVVRLNDNLDFHLELLGLGDRPIRNRQVNVTLKSSDEGHELTLDTISSADGAAQFTIPLSLAFSSDVYTATFSTIVEGHLIDLLTTRMIHIYHFTFEQQNTANYAVIKEHSFPQVKSPQIAYSSGSIFATLEQVKKAYGFTVKNFKTPATFGAAARDGPVVLV